MCLKKLVKIMALNFPNEKVCNNVAAEFQFQHGNLGILQFKSKPQTQKIFSAELLDALASLGSMLESQSLSD